MSLLLSIIIPAYNEEQRIAPSLDKILSFLASRDYRAEVVIVNDGSTDNTAAYVLSRSDEFQAAGIPLRVLTNRPNRGKGYSVKRGIAEAHGEIALFTDADLSSPITEAPKLLDPIIQNHADVTFGSRALHRELIGERQPLYRDFGGRVFNFFLRTITGLKFQDTQCGFKAFRRKDSLAVFERQSIDGFGFDPEVLFIAQKQGLRLMEVPVIWNDVPGSKVGNYALASVKMTADLVQIRLNNLKGRYDAEMKIRQEVGN
ncbi:MAG: glycosyltransferase family 2 protein [Acidobacteria bacterium]|nr:glycosyltransferase family 2 protein [Acidobacteriota bacterium]